MASSCRIGSSSLRSAKGANRTRASRRCCLATRCWRNSTINSGGAEAPDGMTMLILLSSMAPAALLRAAVHDYPVSQGARIEARAAGGVDVVRRIEAGEAVDVVVLARDAIERLVLSGRLAEKSRRDLMA